MNARVTLTVVQGVQPGREYDFDGRMICTVGRAGDCSLQLPNDFIHLDVSRHHCLLDVDPPHVRVRDLGSRNGTYVNGIKIGQRPRGQTPEEAAAADLPEQPLHAGDELKVGSTVLRVVITGEDTPAPEAAEVPATDALLAG